MSRQIICTVGTSLLTNQGWRFGNDLPERSATVAALHGADLTQASAETNTLEKLEVSAQDRVLFLHSDTPEGGLCGEVLAEFYAGRCRDASCERIGKLGYGAAQFSTGLKALVELSLAAVRKAEAAAWQPVFCATGGFKAEIAFLNVLGALLGVEVVYLHEKHRELVSLPRLPLTWDAKIVMDHQRFFEWIDEEPRASHEVESRLHHAPELRSLVEDDGDGHTFLTAAGTLLYKVALEMLSLAPRATWPAADPRPAEDKWNVSKEEHHRPRGWYEYVMRLCAIDCVKRVSYDAQAHSNDRVKVLSEDDGTIGVVYGKSSGDALPLRVETTARGGAQTALVAEYLRTKK